MYYFKGKLSSPAWWSINGDNEAWWHYTEPQESFWGSNAAQSLAGSFCSCRLSNKVACRKFSVFFPRLWPGTGGIYPAHSVPFTTPGQGGVRRTSYRGGSFIAHLGGFSNEGTSWEGWRKRQERARTRNGLKPPQESAERMHPPSQAASASQTHCWWYPRSHTSYSQKSFSLSAREGLVELPQSIFDAPTCQFNLSNTTRAPVLALQHQPMPLHWDEFAGTALKTAWGIQTCRMAGKLWGELSGEKKNSSDSSSFWGLEVTGCQSRPGICIAQR